MMEDQRMIHIRCKGGPLDGQEFDVPASTYSSVYRVIVDDADGKRKMLYRESSRYGLGMDRSKSTMEFTYVPDGQEIVTPYWDSEGVFRLRRERIDDDPDIT